MALSTVESTKILKYLGWALKTIDVTSTHYNSIVASRLTNLTAEAEVLIRGLLKQIEAIDESMQAALCRMSTEQVGDIKINKMEMEMLKKEYLKRIRELSDMLDIDIERTGASLNIGVIV